MNKIVDLKSFWMRRILRIWPLYYFCVLFGFVFFPILKQFFGGYPNEHANPFYFITFLSNFDMIYNTRPDASILSVLWSVAIEEQFYFVWPIIIFLVPLKKLWIPFAFIIGTSYVFRAYNNNGLLNELHTISCIGDMTIGAIGAWLILLNKKFKSRIISMSKWEITSIYILFTFFFFLRIQFENLGSIFMVLERSLIAILILLIILEQSYSRNSYFKMSSFKTISSLGSISYGLYCFHFIGLLFVTTLTRILGFNTHLWQVLILETILALLTSIFISKVSYKYFESPFLKFKNRFSYITKS